MDLNVKKFLDSRHSSMWIVVGSLEVYVRKSVRQNPRGHGLIRCFDIANVTSSIKGAGNFTNFFCSLRNLDEYGFQAIYIEQVLRNRFGEFFRRNKCLEVKDLSNIPSFFYFLEG